MNNYMQKIADMLGVELGEVFYIKQGEHNIKFILSKDGLHQVVCIDGKETCGILSHRIFGKILTGEAKIIKRPWKPSNLECYYKVKKWDNTYLLEDELYLNSWAHNDSLNTKHWYPELVENYYMWLYFSVSSLVLRWRRSRSRNIRNRCRKI